MKKLSWSYTALTAFETCPRRYYLTKVAKSVTEPQTEATLWGNRVHKALELRIKDKTPLPEGMTQWEGIAARIETANGRVFTEQQVCLNENMQPTSWFGKDAWVRGIVDVGVDAGKVMWQGDYKTGKRKPDSMQMMLFAALAFERYPYIEKVKTSFLWLKDGKVDKSTFNRDELPTIWMEFLPRVARLEQALDNDKFPPKPSGLCREWCPVGRSNCEFCGK